MADKLEIIITAKDQASGTFGKVKNALFEVSKFATGMIAADVFVNLANGVSDFFTGSIGEAREAIANQKELAQVIKSTGGIAGVSADEANSYAEALSKVTNFSDDTILKGENMLLTFTNIGENVFPRATKAMVDMGQKFGSVDTAAVQLGKALNDPIKGVGALSKIGVTFTEQQKEQIKAMMESGDIAKAQGVILAELEKQVGGLAEAVADPAIQMKNMWADFKEEVGMAVVPTLNQLSQIALPLLSQAIDFIKPHLGLLTIALQGVVTWLQTTGIPTLQRFANWFINVAIPVIQPFVNLVGSLLVQAFQFLTANINTILPILGVLAGLIFVLSSPLALIASLVTALGVAWSNNWFNIQQKTQTVLDFLKPYWADLTKIFNQFIQLLLPELQKAWLELQAVWSDSIRPALRELWKSVQQLGQVLGFSTGKTDIWKIALGTLKIILNGVIVTARALRPVIRAVGEVISFGVDNVRRFVDMLRSMKRSADSLIGVIRGLRDNIRSLIDAAANMPSWLIPGSPTPFELGIRGIANAVKSLPTMELPNIAPSGLPALAPAGVGSSVGGGVPHISIHVDYHPTVSMADKIELEAALGQTVQNIIRNYNAGKR